MTKDIILYLVIFLSLSIIGVITKCENDNRYDRLERTIATQDSILKREINSLGQAVTIASTKVFDYSPQLIALDEKFKALDNRLRTNGDKLKQLQSSVGFLATTSEQTGVTDTIRIQEIKRDTLWKENALQFVGTSWSYADSLLNLNSLLLPNFQLEHTYTINPINFYIDIVKERQEFLTKISTDNPKFLISDTNVFLKHYPKPIWSLSIGVGGSAMFHNNSLLFGPSINLHVGRNILHLKYK